MKARSHLWLFSPSPYPIHPQVLWVCLQDISQIYPLLSVSTAIILEQAVPTSCLDCCNNLTGLQESTDSSTHPPHCNQKRCFSDWNIKWPHHPISYCQNKQKNMEAKKLKIKYFLARQGNTCKERNPGWVEVPQKYQKERTERCSY